MPASLENSAVAIGLEKVSFHSNPKEKQCQRMFKLPHKCTNLTCQQSNAQNSPGEASTVCVLRTSRYSSWIQKGRGTRHQIANIHWITEKAREFQKNIYFCFIDYIKAFDCVDHNKLWEILQAKVGITDYLTCLLRNLYARQEATVRTGCETMDWFKLGKECVTAVYCHPAYLTFMQNTSCKMLGWMKHKLELRLPGEISTTSDT